MAVSTSTGILLALSVGRPATVDAAGFAAKTYTNLGELTSVPAFGPTTAVVEHNPLATGITEKYKGFINNGSMSMEAAFDDEDAGQILVSEGVTGANKFSDYSFKLTYPSGAVRYWYAGVFSYTENPGAANSMVGTTINVEINSVIVKVAAP